MPAHTGRAIPGSEGNTQALAEPNLPVAVAAWNGEGEAGPAVPVTRLLPVYFWSTPLCDVTSGPQQVPGMLFGPLYEVSLTLPSLG